MHCFQLVLSDSNNCCEKCYRFHLFFAYAPSGKLHYFSDRDYIGITPLNTYLNIFSLTWFSFSAFWISLWCINCVTIFLFLCVWVNGTLLPYSVEYYQKKKKNKKIWWSMREWLLWFSEEYLMETHPKFINGKPAHIRILFTGNNEKL